MNEIDLETAVRVLRGIGQLAQELRQERNLSQETVAARIGMSYYDYRALEIGRPGYQLADMLEAVAKQRPVMPRLYKKLTEEQRRALVHMDKWEIHQQFGVSYGHARVWRKNAWAEFGKPEEVARKPWTRQY